MSDTAVQVDQVWKKFKRGQEYDSLRDFVPGLVRKFLSRKRSELQKKEFWAVQDLSFELKKGDVLGLIGPNGSGKSTTLKMLNRILRPNSGSIKVNGRQSALIELGAGFHPDLTGRENIFLNGTILGMKKNEIAKRFDEIVEFSELKDFLDTPVKRYSSGMQARLGFSVAAHVDSEVMLVDEVLSVGDYHFQEKCFTKMREFANSGTTILFVSHNLAAVGSLCKTALLLDHGKLIFHGDVPTAISKYHNAHGVQVTGGRGIEVVESHVFGEKGEERDVFEPGETIHYEVTLKATASVRNAHAAVIIQSAEGSFVFDTATSKLTTKRISLQQGETAKVVFSMDMNLQNGMFFLGFTVTPEVELAQGDFLYCNMGLKKVVMTGDRKSNSMVYLNPRADIHFSPDTGNAEKRVAEVAR